jgi:ATP synthase protein I
MRKIISSAGYDDLDQQQDDEVIKPLTRSEAQMLREQHPALSPWAVLLAQAGAGLVVGVVALLLTGEANVAWSALYGVAAVVIPAAVFARGLTSKVSLANPAAAVTGFFLWEMVKIGLTVAMLVSAPWVILDLSWLAMVAGFVVTMKVYWLALWFRFVRPVGKKTLN